MPLILKNPQTAHFQEAIAATDEHNATGTPRQVRDAFYAVRGRPLPNAIPAIGGETQFYRHFSGDFLQKDPAQYCCLHELYEHPPIRTDIVRVIQAIAQQCLDAVGECAMAKNENPVTRAFPCVNLSELSGEALQKAETDNRIALSVQNISSAIGERVKRLLVLMDAVPQIADAVKKQIRQCTLFEGIETMREQARQIGEIIRAVKIDSFASDTRAVINQPAAAYLNGANGKPVVLKSKNILPVAALANVINQLELVPTIRELAALVDFTEYVYQTARTDSKMPYRTYPEIVDSKDGLAFDFQGLTFPFSKKEIRVWELGNSGTDMEAYGTMARLGRDGFAWYCNQMGSVGSTLGFYFWEEGLTEEKLNKELDKLGLAKESKLRRNLVLSLGSSAYLPFGDIKMGWSGIGTDADSRIKFLSGPNMAGKTTLMRSIGCALNMGAVGRKVCASSARMTLPDHIFDNFNLGDDLQKGLSTFKAQLVNIERFLRQGTLDSLVLLDEFLNGTSPIYQLAIGWAIAERLERKNRRAVIATHDPYIPFMCEKDGFEQIKGVFANVPQAGKSNYEGRMSAMSVGTNRNLVGRPSIDSEAFGSYANYFE